MDWTTALRESVARRDRGEPCWCGNPVNGHAGWLICAERSVTPDHASGRPWTQAEVSCVLDATGRPVPESMLRPVDFDDGSDDASRPSMAAPCHPDRLHVRDGLCAVCLLATDDASRGQS